MLAFRSLSVFLVDLLEKFFYFFVLKLFEVEFATSRLKGLQIQESSLSWQCMLYLVLVCVAPQKIGSQSSMSSKHMDGGERGGEGIHNSCDQTHAHSSSITYKHT